MGYKLSEDTKKFISKMNLRGLNVDKELDKIKDYIELLEEDKQSYIDELRKLREEYDKDKMKWICSLTSVHKLSYKLDSQIANSDNIYRHIINNDL